MAFYKDDHGELLSGPHFVLNRDYKLRAEYHDTYTYPVDGWYWFDTETEARIFFNIPLPPEPETEPENLTTKSWL